MLRLSIGIAICMGLGASGCAQEDLTDEDIEEFRTGLLSDDEFGEDPNLPGNGDLTIFFGNEANIPGCDIWDLMGGGTSDAQTGERLQVIQGDEILDPDGTLLCIREGNELFERVRDTDDNVVFSVIGPFVFDGDLELDGSWWENMLELHHKLLYTFHDNHVFDGLVWHGEVLVSADVNIQLSSRMRKFTIASLIAGECGGPGLPMHPDHL